MCLIFLTQTLNLNWISLRSNFKDFKILDLSLGCDLWLMCTDFFSCSNKQWKVTFKVGIYLSCCISWMMHRRSYKHSDLFPIILKVAKETNEDISRNSEIFKFVACCISNYFIKELDLRRKFYASRRRPVFCQFLGKFYNTLVTKIQSNAKFSKELFG